MVKITNGRSVFQVTRGAFDGIYSRQGFVIMEDEKKLSETPEMPQAPEKTEDEKFLEEIVEKPVSQWNKDEVKRFAALNEIDITGTKNVNEAKEIVKQFLSNEE